MYILFSSFNCCPALVKEYQMIFYTVLVILSKLLIRAVQYVKIFIIVPYGLYNTLAKSHAALYGND